jgi:SWIM zinc finger
MTTHTAELNADIAQEARLTRALVTEFEWATDPASRAICTNPESGRTYLVTQTTCGCPDFQFRGSRTGAACKHIISLRHREAFR